MNGIVIAAIVVAGIGLAAGILLGIASIVFSVKQNEKEQKLLEVLPGANCGACSFAGCADYARALATGKVKITLCPVGGEAGVKKIAAVLGVEAGETRKKVAFVHCAGDCGHAKQRAEYKGVSSCYAANLLCKGEKACPYGCAALGDCVAACKYDAISVKDGVAVVDCSKCVGCGMCAAACPKKLITLVYAGDYAHVVCRNADKGAETRAVCSTGCIGCSKCVKTCENGAITLLDNHAQIDIEKCVGCGKCVSACPVGAIKM